jgi:hypothetical protein
VTKRTKDAMTSKDPKAVFGRSGDLAGSPAGFPSPVSHVLPLSTHSFHMQRTTVVARQS